MTPSQILTHARAVRALWPAGQKTMTKDAMSKRKGAPKIAGSDLEQVYKAMQGGRKSTLTLVWLDEYLAKASATPTPPVVAPPTPPVSVPEPTGEVRSLLNEQVFTDTSGNRLNFQNDGKPGSTEYIGPGHYRARLPAAINGVIQGQRPSERVPKSTKRRSEGSGIKVTRPVDDQVVIVKCRYKFKPQAFAANMQWVMPFQLHGAGNTGSPWFAVRIEKDGWWLATINTSVNGSSTNLRPSPKFKPEPDVWHESEVRWSANHVGFYHNGKMVAEYNGAIGWEEEGTPYLKWLVYNSQGSTEATEVEVADLTVNGKPAGILV